MNYVPSRYIHTLVHILRFPNHCVAIVARIKISKQQRHIQIVSSGCDIDFDIVVCGVYNTSHSFLGPFKRLEGSMSRTGGSIASIERYKEVCADESG